MITQQYPGLKNMTIKEVRIMTAVCKKDGYDSRKTWKTITCIDDCLSILQRAPTINGRRSNQKNRGALKKKIEARITQANI